MTPRPKEEAINELKTIPGVGKSIAEDLWKLGIKSIRDLRHRNPRRLYELLCERTGTRQDICLLYTFRCAVYYASQKRHNPELLKWWNWKEDMRKSTQRTSKQRT